jgi:hypothetical protein
MKPYLYWHKRINVPAATEALAGTGINVIEIDRFVDKTMYKKFQVATIPVPI